MKQALLVICSLPKYTAMALIRFYQRYISPYTRPTCRFVPSCSQYMLTSIERYGFVKGLWMGVKRLIRCNPWNKGGYDPVP